MTHCDVYVMGNSDIEAEYFKQFVNEFPLNLQ